MNWTLTEVEFSGNKVKVYVNGDDSRAIVFPPFGKYFSLLSDNSALDFAVSFIFFSSSRDINYTQYLSSQEDTSVIFQEAA